MKGASLEVLSDTLGSIGVIVAAIVWGITGWTWVDPIVGAAIGVFILPRAYGSGARPPDPRAGGARPHRHPRCCTPDLAAIPGVVDVHDLHVWTLTSEMEVASAHIMVSVGTDHHAVLDEAREVLGTNTASPMRRCRSSPTTTRAATRWTGERRGCARCTRRRGCGVRCAGACGASRSLTHGHVVAALSSNLLLLVTLPVLAWGTVALAGGGELRGPWTVPSRAWVSLGCSRSSYTVLRNLPVGAALAP